MRVYFLHNHYLPAGIKNNDFVKSVIVPEFYPDLNMTYLGEPCYFSAISDYFKHVLAHGYYQPDTVFSVENPAIFKNANIKKQLELIYALRVRICQIYCGKDNNFYTSSLGLSDAGKKFLSALSEQGIILDLSHVPNRHIKSIAENYDGKIVVSHCACSAQYIDKGARSNSLSDDNIKYLSHRSTIFGVSFLSDIVSATNSDIKSTQLFRDIIEQILYLVDKVGSKNVGLGPDFIDVKYFSKRFGVSLYFPEEAYSLEGLYKTAEHLSEYLSVDDIENIFWRNADSIFQ